MGSLLLSGRPVRVVQLTPKQVALVAQVLGADGVPAEILLVYKGGPGGGGSEAAPEGGARGPIYRIRQESVRRREGRYDHTEISRWRVWFGYVEVLLPECLGSEELILLIRNQAKEFAADELTEEVRKSMPGPGNGSEAAGREIVGRGGSWELRARSAECGVKDRELKEPREKNFGGGRLGEAPLPRAENNNNERTK